MPIRPCRKEVTGLFAHRTENISNGTSAFLPEVDDLETGDRSPGYRYSRTSVMPALRFLSFLLPVRT